MLGSPASLRSDPQAPMVQPASLRSDPKIPFCREQGKKIHPNNEKKIIADLLSGELDPNSKVSNIGFTCLPSVGSVDAVGLTCLPSVGSVDAVGLTCLPSVGSVDAVGLTCLPSVGSTGTVPILLYCIKEGYTNLGRLLIEAGASLEDIPEGTSFRSTIMERFLKDAKKGEWKLPLKICDPEHPRYEEYIARWKYLSRNRLKRDEEQKSEYIKKHDEKSHDAWVKAWLNNSENPVAREASLRSWIFKYHI